LARIPDAVRVTDGERADTTLASAKLGDEPAVAALFRHWQPRLLAFFRAAGADQPEDLTSDVWLDVARSLARFEGDHGAFGGWLFTIARRRLIDDRRRIAARPCTADAEAVELTSTLDTDRDVMQRISHDAAVRTLAELPPDQAEVLLLRVVAGLDTAAVAELLGKTSGAVRVLQHRGLRRLAERHRMRGVTP
jgi:RNA polymerase sigma-70 factor (ECF subfamily)